MYLLSLSDGRLIYEPMIQAMIQGSRQVILTVMLIKGEQLY